MVDIHSHIIWNIDDGSKSKDMTIKMLNQAVKSGTKHIIATPHFTRGYFEVPYKELKERFEEMKELIKENDLDINVHLGQEVYYRENLLELYEEGIIGTINEGKYMLLELPMRAFDVEQILDVTYELQIKGITLILAHPERYIPFIKNPACINRFIEEGFLFQLNAGSLVGDFSSDAKKLAHKYLEAGIYSFLGSDVHDLDSRNSDLTRINEVLSKENKEVLKSFNENGLKLLNNEEVNFIGKKIVTTKGKSNKKSIFEKIFAKNH